MELEPSVVLFTLLVLLVATVLLRRKSGGASSSAGNKTPKAHPEPLSTLVSEPVKEEPLTQTAYVPSTLFESTKDSEPDSTLDTHLESTIPVVSAILPATVSKLVSVQETNSNPEPVLPRLAVPEMVPEPEVITKLECVIEPVLEAISAPESFAVPKTAPQPKVDAKPECALKPLLEALSELEPDSVQETALHPERVLEPVPKIVPQLETAACTLSIQVQVSKSTPELVVEEFSEAQAALYPETSSEPEPEMVCSLIPPSKEVSMLQAIQEEEPSSNPVSELKPAVQSGLETEKVLEVVAEWVSGPINAFELVSRAPKENPTTIVTETAVKPELEPEPEIKEVTASQEKVRFSPGKKQNKFETLMTKEEMEEEQRVQQEQLAAIFLLLRENQQALGEVTEGDMEEQLKLYSL